MATKSTTVTPFTWKCLEVFLEGELLHAIQLSPFFEKLKAMYPES